MLSFSVRKSTAAVFGAGEIIIREGEVGDAAYIIENGAVQVYVTAADGSEVVTARLEGGAHFGEQALLHAQKRTQFQCARGNRCGSSSHPGGGTMLEILVGDSALRVQ